MTSCLCANTRRAARLLTLHYDAELGKAGLSAAQFELLSLLSYGERNGRGIAAALALDTTTVSRNLKPLLADGLVAASNAPDDARLLLYRLTAAGKARLRKAQPLWQRAQTAIESRLALPTNGVLHSLQALSSAAAATNAT